MCELSNAAAATAKGFEPLWAEPNGFLVHHLNHSVTLSCSSTLRTGVSNDVPGAGAASHVKNCNAPAAFGRNVPDLHVP